jgi:hypothetical protein
MNGAILQMINQLKLDGRAAPRRGHDL